MILLWVALALALTGLWVLGAWFAVLIAMDDDSAATRVAQLVVFVVVSAAFGFPAFLVWHHVAGFHR